MLDILNNRGPESPAELRGVRAAGVSFSPDGSRLAVTSRPDALRIFDLSAMSHPRELERPSSLRINGPVLFVDDSALAVETPDGTIVVTKDGKRLAVSAPNGYDWDADGEVHEFVIGGEDGVGLVIDVATSATRARAVLCKGEVRGVRFVPRQGIVAYACKDGTLGTWDLARNVATPREHLEGHADFLEVSRGGDYVIAAGGNGTVAVVDLRTDLVSSYRGHGFRLTALAAPTPEFPAIVSGDVRGGLRIWPLPSRIMAVSADAGESFKMAMFAGSTNTVVATTLRAGLTTVSPATGAREIGPHVGRNMMLAQSENDGLFAAYGYTNSVEIWSLSTMSRTRVIETGHESVPRAEFVEGTGALITAGQDGNLVEWPASGESENLAHLDQPITDFVIAAPPRTVVLSTSDGALWRAGAGSMQPLRPAGAHVTRMTASPDRRSVWVGYADGTAVLVDTRSWQQTVLFKGRDAVRDIAFTADSRTVAVSTNDGAIRIGSRTGDAWGDPAKWLTISLHARKLALAPDGLLVAASTDGNVWIYSPARGWLCLPTGTADLVQVIVATDGKTGAALDTGGRLISIDLQAARKTLADSATKE